MINPTSPDTPLSEAEFARLLQRGLGRAVLYLQQHDSAPYCDAIVHACLHYLEYDGQTEGDRSPFLFDAIQASGRVEFFADLVRTRLLHHDEADARGQLFGLAKLLARDGDGQTRRAMYAAFADGSARQDPTGGDDLVELDGLAGYQFVVNQLMRHPLPAEDRWQEELFLSTLQERLGKDKTRAALDEASAANPRLAAYLAPLWEEQAADEARCEARRRNPGTFVVPRYEEIRRLAAEPGRKISRMLWARWGERADEELCKRLAADLLVEQRLDAICKLLWFFKKRVFPLGPHRLLELAQSEDLDIRQQARRALANVVSPEVRAWGLGLLSSPRPWEGVDMLIANAEAGDYALLEPLAARAWTPGERSADEYHWTGMSIEHYVDAHPGPEAAQTLTRLYENQPCTLCRHRAVEHLLKVGLLPDWMREECRYDADLETRKLVAS